MKTRPKNRTAGLKVNGILILFAGLISLALGFTAPLPGLRDAMIVIGFGVGVAGGSIFHIARVLGRLDDRFKQLEEEPK